MVNVVDPLASLVLVAFVTFAGLGAMAACFWTTDPVGVAMSVALEEMFAVFADIAASLAIVKLASVASRTALWAWTSEPIATPRFVRAVDDVGVSSDKLFDIESASVDPVTPRFALAVTGSTSLRLFATRTASEFDGTSIFVLAVDAVAESSDRLYHFE